MTGLVAQQQCVGPLHTPLADVAVTALSHFDTVSKQAKTYKCNVFKHKCIYTVLLLLNMQTSFYRNGIFNKL